MKVAQIRPEDIKTSFANFIWTHLTAQDMLEWDDLLARAKFVMGENIVKNSVEAGEFNEFLQEHGAVEQFVRILIRRCYWRKNIHVLYSLQENRSVAPSYCIVRVIKKCMQSV